MPRDLSESLVAGANIKSLGTSFASMILSESPLISRELAFCTVSHHRLIKRGVTVGR